MRVQVWVRVRVLADVSQQDHVPSKLPTSRSAQQVLGSHPSEFHPWGPRFCLPPLSLSSPCGLGPEPTCELFICPAVQF